jgi:hypothetical protein
MAEIEVLNREAQPPAVGRPRSVARLAWASALVLIAALMALPFLRVGDWRTASMEPVGLAPDPAQTRDAVIQVYGARTWGWKGYFGVHTWVAVKPANAKAYTVYEVIGWRLRWGNTVLVVRDRAPDERWFGAVPELLADRRGAGVDDLIKRVEAAARAYPYAGEYRLWPGPNSNTFTAWIGRAVPELEIDMPATAIGKDYLGGRVFATAPSGHGVQFSLFGVLGLIASRVEGLEVNVLGLIVGLHPLRPAINLPIFGRIGPSR